MGSDSAMWAVLTVVTILTCHLSLGEDGLSIDTLDSLEQVGLSKEPRYSCPQNNVCFDGHTIVEIPGIVNWHDCGIICIHTDDCNFWTWYNNRNCYLKTSDRGLAYDESAISGEKGCHSDQEL